MHRMTRRTKADDSMLDQKLFLIDILFVHQKSPMKEQSPGILRAKVVHARRFYLSINLCCPCKGSTIVFQPVKLNGFVVSKFQKRETKYMLPDWANTGFPKFIDKKAISKTYSSDVNLEIARSLRENFTPALACLLRMQCACASCSGSWAQLVIYSINPPDITYVTKGSPYHVLNGFLNTPSVRKYLSFKWMYLDVL